MANTHLFRPETIIVRSSEVQEFKSSGVQTIALLKIFKDFKDLKAFKEPQTSIHASVVGSMEFHAVPFQCQCGNLFALVGLHDDVLSLPGELDDDYRPYLNPLVELLFGHLNLPFGV